jgi:hypothetical protein
VAEAVQALPTSDDAGQQAAAPGPRLAPARATATGTVAGDITSFKPLAESTLGAFDFLLRVLPSDPAPQDRSADPASTTSPDPL